MSDKVQTIIIGGGAAGLMAARELSRNGQSVVILEARDRIGGRIWPLSEKGFGYPAQGGAEYVHGPAKITMSLIAEAGLTYISTTQGESWNVRDNDLYPEDRPMPYLDLLHDQLKALDIDMPIATFLDQHFSEEKYTVLRDSIFRMVEGYDAADPQCISAFSLRSDWFRWCN